MAHSKNNKGNSGKGFGAMDENRQREIARQGGHASAQGNTSNRGFASMDKDKQREISSQGGKASQGSSARNQRGATGRNEQNPSKKSTQHENHNRNEKAHSKDLTGKADLSERDLNSLEEEDEITSSRRGQASYSETDEDEDEGLGDGQMGRMSRGHDEEG
jgi:general stress protein YciG